MADASGNGNGGSIGTATWTTASMFGNALSFDGTSSRVTVNDASSLDLTTTMTLEAWVHPAAGSSSWRDVIYKVDDIYYLEGSSPSGQAVMGGTFSATPLLGAPLPLNTWSHLAATYDGTTMRLYVNGVEVANRAQTGAIQTSTGALTIGGDALYGQYFAGRIDEVRIYNTALTAAQIQADMTTPIVPPSDPSPPSVAITSPENNAQVTNIFNVTADASDNIGVAGVQFLVDGAFAGVEAPDPPYSLAWDTRTVSNGAHTLTARARDTAGNFTLSAPVSVGVTNSSSFQNEVLATGFDLPTNIEFLPDGRMLVVELEGTIKVLSPPYTEPSPTLFLQLTNVGSAGVQQGIYDIALDPDFSTNHFYYAFYTLGSPNRDRLSRFTADATITGTIAGSELVLYQDPQDANAEHHGGSINFGNDGKLYFTTGEHFGPGASQLLTNPRGKLHRINPDGTVPSDNPFYDGAGPNIDSIWSLGLRNPFRAYYDAPTGRFYIGDVGGNDYSTAREDIELGGRGANYGWPDCEVGTCGNPAFTAALYSYPHNGRDACITGGFVYHGTAFPSGYQGSYFFADYTQNWIKRVTFDAGGNVNGTFNFEPDDGSVDGPYGDIVYLTEGPDGALYYVDLGYSDISLTFGVSKIRRIRYTQGNQPPNAIAAANPTSGPVPLDVNFSSAGSSDPEGQPLTYSWTFGDNTSSSAPNPTHTYFQAGPYSARLSVSDGVNTTISTPLAISAGNPPTATVLAPLDGSFFEAGDVISFSGDGTDPDDGALPASAFNWNIDFLHEGHFHPGIPVTGVKSGAFTIPTVGHDFSGDTRYRITLTVTDSDGLTSTQFVLIYPRKVALSFDTLPSGLTIYLDGIAKATPFIYDALIGFLNTVEARNQISGTTAYTFTSWSDGEAQNHDIVVPSFNQDYVATFQASASGVVPVAAYSFDEGTGTTVADVSVNAITGTINGATWTTAGKYGNALSYDGSSSHVDLGNPAALQLAGSMSWTAWVKAAADPADDGQIVAKSDGTSGWQFKTSPDTGPHTFGVGVSGGAGALTQRYSSAVRLLNVWYHVGGVYDAAAGTLDTYVNGVLNNGALVGTIPAAQIDSAINVNIGRRTGGFYFNGIIDEVRIYDTALTQAQIQTDMATPIGAGSPPDTEPPTAPTNLAATLASSSQIDLSWTASIDNIVVIGYRIERCEGPGCSSFVQVSTATGTAYSDTGLTSNASYSYRVRATDAANNLGPYSTTVSATTLATSRRFRHR